MFPARAHRDDLATLHQEVVLLQELLEVPLALDELARHPGTGVSDEGHRRPVARRLARFRDVMNVFITVSSK